MVACSRLKKHFPWKLFLLVLSCSEFAEAIGEDRTSERITKAVNIIEEVKDAVVPLFSFDEKYSLASAGTGVFIDRAGYLLTASHVLAKGQIAILVDMKPVQVKLVGSLPERDLALLQVVNYEGNFRSIPLGRSETVKLGEPIVLGGNPSGRGIVYSQGTINSVSIEPSWPNIFVKALWQQRTKELSVDRSYSTGGRIDYIQYDATSNRGNSGGPVINYESQVIGISSKASPKETGIYWAIPVDRIRTLMPHLVPAEEVGDYWTGIEMDLLSSKGQVKQVIHESPAWTVGVRPGDIITSVNQHPIEQGYEWYLRLWETNKAASVEITVLRDGSPITFKIPKTTFSVHIPFAEGTDKIPSTIKPGLEVSVYKGVFPTLSNLEGKVPDDKQIRSDIDVTSLVPNGHSDDPFAVVYEGFFKVSAAGLYRVSIASDDGSRLFLGNRLFIDNDLNHPHQKLSRVVRLQEGLMPFRLEYSDFGGAKELSLALQAIDAEGEDVDLEYYHLQELESAAP